MKEQKEFKGRKHREVKEVLKKNMLFPFKDKESEKSFGFVFSILGIVLMMFGISNPSSYFIPSLLSTALTGFIIFFVGLFYFVDSLS